MKALFRCLAFIGIATLLSACSGAGTVAPAVPEAASMGMSADVNLRPLSRAQQDAIRASTPTNPRWIADLVARQRIGAERHDRWYAMTTRGDGGRRVLSVRHGRTMVMITSCNTTYLNISGTYDTSTDPIIRQSCSTSYVDDGGGALPVDGGGPVPLPTLDPNLYQEPAKNFDRTTEKACKVGGKTTFISVSKNSPDTGSAPSPGTTECGPKNDNSILVLTGGKLYPYPGGCNFLVVLTSRNISVNPASGNDMLPQTSTADGIRINADCSFDFVRI